MLSIVSILIVYSTLLNVLILLSLFIKKYSKSGIHNTKEKFLSVIVAIRNESLNIHQLINSLSNQNYPDDKYEVILVDDYSEDNSYSLAKKIANEKKQLKVIKNKYNPGKKNALRTGIEEAKGEILLFTDADCIPKPDWLKSISNEYDINTDLVYGYSPFLPTKSFLNKLCRYENLCTSALMTVFHNVEYPYMSFGRNLSYKKSLFEKVGGFEKIQRSLSGDDDLFFQLAIQNKAKVKLADSPDAIVFTKCVSRFNEYIIQKSRHISASKFYPFEIKIILGLIYGSNIFLNLCVVLAFLIFDPFLLSFVLINWMVKTLTILKICSIIKCKFPYVLIPLIDFIYNFTLIITGIRSRLKVVKWK